jgi:nitrate/TMAO reductase-like tetraheme cytochrome c subunit
VIVFTSHWLAMTGLGLVLTALVLWGCLFTVELRHGEGNPYIGVGMIGVGVLFALGLVATPIGLYRARRKLRQRIGETFSDRKPGWRRFFVFLAVISILNVLVASQMTMRAVHVMESKQFCASCHVMTPVARAHARGPHAGILCVDCHVGEGATGFIKAKLAGTRQLYQVMTDTVHMPLATAIESGRMIPSDKTCETCHWTRKPADARLTLIRRYAEDEANTPTSTLLTMKIGGERMGGIHGAHNSEGVEIEFVARDPQRQDIPLVVYRNKKTGVERTYVKAGEDAAALSALPRIRMQCFDCHNRVGHEYLPPDRAVDEALMLGRIPVSLPFVKLASMKVLTAEYASSAAAAEAIPAALTAYYEREQPQVASAKAAEIREAGAVLADIYAQNVFPELRMTWGLYKSNIGHQTSLGCLRCHAGEHSTAAGEQITKNCFRCHFPASVDDANPQVLEMLGLDKMLNQLEKR